MVAVWKEKEKQEFFSPSSFISSFSKFLTDFCLLDSQSRGGAVAAKLLFLAFYD